MAKIESVHVYLLASERSERDTLKGVQMRYMYVCSATCILRDLLVSKFIFASSLAAIVSPLYNEGTVNH